MAEDIDIFDMEYGLRKMCGRCHKNPCPPCAALIVMHEQRDRIEAQAERIEELQALDIAADETIAAHCTRVATLEAKLADAESEVSCDARRLRDLETLRAALDYAWQEGWYAAGLPHGAVSNPYRATKGPSDG
jgi:hypothetical protein